MLADRVSDAGRRQGESKPTVTRRTSRPYRVLKGPLSRLKIGLESRRFFLTIGREEAVIREYKQEKKGERLDQLGL